jgi:hypothetical protein
VSQSSSYGFSCSSRLVSVFLCASGSDLLSILFPACLHVVWMIWDSKKAVYYITYFEGYVVVTRMSPPN